MFGSVARTTARVIALGALVAGAMVGVGSAPAVADHRWRDDHDCYGDYCYERPVVVEPRYYAPPPVYYAPPSPIYYAPPPPVYYAPPPPVYYAPPPRRFYPDRPYFSIGLGF